jgi:hypothetical protein
MHQHEMQQSNIYLGIYTIEYYFLLEKSGCYSTHDARCIVTSPCHLGTTTKVLSSAMMCTST